MTTTTFKGARYIVKFADPIEWDATRAYEAIESVQHEGFTYISKQPVPVGVQIDNEAFWLCWADPNAQMEQLRQLVSGYVDDVEAMQVLIPASDFSAESTVKDYIDTAITDVSGIIPANAFNSTDTVKKYIDDADYKRAIVFNTIADMKASDILQFGMICHTNGFYASGDGGAAWYKIGNSGTANEMDVIACGELFASYIPQDEIIAAQFGCVENADISENMSIMLDYNLPINGMNKSYIMNNPVYAPKIFKLKNTKINFNHTATGFFIRADNTDYKSPLTRIIDEVEIENCEFYNAIDINTGNVDSYSAAMPIYAKHVKVIDSIFRDNECNGLMLYGENASAFENVYINNCIAFNNGSYNQNTSTRIKTAMGIGSYQDVNNYNSHVSIENCVCYENANSGIGFHGLNNVHIHDCKCYTNFEHGITVQSALKAVIANCISFNNSIRQIRIQGDWNISPTYCKNIIVSNCILNGNNIFGIGGGCSGIVIDNCIIVKETSGNIISLDPMGKWDNNITVKNCKITFPEDVYYQKKALLAQLTACEQDVICIDNIVNNVINPIDGEVLNRTDTIEPTQLFITALPYIYGLADSVPTINTSQLTVSENEYTTEAGSGYLYADIPLSEIKKYVAFYIEGEYTHINSNSNNGIRPQMRGGANTIEFSNRTAAQSCKVSNTKCKYCMVLDKTELEEVYTDSTTIRFRFIVSNVIGDTFKLDKILLFK